MILALLLSLDLAALAQIESGNNPAAVGDHGTARGLYQMRQPAWSDVSASRAKRGLKVYPFEKSHDAAISTEYAREYLAILSKHFTATQGHQPTQRQLYALWNLGFKGFERRGFCLSKCPQSTRLAASTIK